MSKDYNKILILVSIGIIIVLHQLVFVPGQKELSSLRNLAARKSVECTNLKNLCEEYLKKEQKDAGTEPNFSAADFSLLTYTGELVNRLSLRELLKEVKPMPEREKDGVVVSEVNLILENITLEQIYKILNEIEKPDNSIYISKFQMARDKRKTYLLNVKMSLFVIKATPKEEG